MGRGTPVGSNPFSNPQPIVPGGNVHTDPISQVENPYQDDGVSIFLLFRFLHINF